MGEEFLLEFNHEEQEGEGHEMGLVGIYPRLDRAFKVVDDSHDGVHLFHRFVLEITVAGVLKNAHSCNGCMANREDRGMAH